MKRKSSDFEVIYIETDRSEKDLERIYKSKEFDYGITREQFLELAKKNNNRCAACGAYAGKEPHALNVDHNHETNEIRGLLCEGCNTALGWIDDSPKRAEYLAEYLRNSGTGIYIPETGYTESW